MTNELPKDALDQATSLEELLTVSGLSHRQIGIKTKTPDMRTLKKRIDNPRLLPVGHLEKLAEMLKLDPAALFAFVLKLEDPDKGSDDSAAEPATGR
ncbi:hypothetical protein [Hymenobacter jeollabukensis]|uniref:XRE family transcriptional regulator n=1 Tax=Hymenobacter jeollabukensis TaxID=2025313 RepID=A0A5R8WIL3_9BACT|nr:hypothetical protein [Hymenobacter jeollabukensis]TLM88716.1 hypothetical protein FDY95_23050 [Hymenobacter jeollabukensis]